MKSLKARQSSLSSGTEQIRILNSETESIASLAKFSDTLTKHQIHNFLADKVDIFQMNLGKMCNQACKHCHVDAGPDRKEIMSKETLEQCISIVKEFKIPTVDLTGGAPEMHPQFRYLVESLSELNCKVMVRCNLTIILANKKYNDLPEFFAKHKVVVVSSLPYYQKNFTDRQRGDGVFEDSIQALKMLNAAGYAKPGSGLELNLVYNPAGAFLPASQALLEADFKKELKRLFDIEFNSLYCITNMPISRYLEFLQKTNNLESYMHKLVNSFNPSTVQGLMCKNTLSISWDGFIYDCDFNQMLDLKVSALNSQHISEFNMQSLLNRKIIVDQHCFGCTAGSGSSCGGATA